MDKRIIYDYCKKLREEGKPWNEIRCSAIKCKIITSNMEVSGLIDAYREVAGKIAAGIDVPKNGGYTEYEKQFASFIKAGELKNVENKINSTYSRNLIISDLHCPYHDVELLTEFVRIEGDKNARLIIAGDFLNGTQLSERPKTVVEDFKEEVAKGRVVLEFLAKNFGEVILLDDNHVHSRWERYISKVLTPDLQFLTIHPYDFLIAGLKNVKRVKSEYHIEEFGWMFVLGDAVITHAETTSSVDMRPARRVEEFVKKWSYTLGLPEIRFVAQAHNHRLGIVYDSNSAVCHTGCFVGIDGLKYAMKAEIKYSPPIHGYTVLTQVDGVTDLSETYVMKLQNARKKVQK